MWNVQILTVSAVKICKQCLQTASASGDRPSTPLRDFRPPKFRGCSPQIEVLVLPLHLIVYCNSDIPVCTDKCVLSIKQHSACWLSHSKAPTAIVLKAVAQTRKNEIVCQALRSVYVTVYQAVLRIHSALYIDKITFVIGLSWIIYCIQHVSVL